MTLLATITGSVTITPSASNSDGVFDPTSVSLSNASPTQTFTYTPSIWGSRQISVTNNHSPLLADPIYITFLAKIQTGSSGTNPSGGNQTPDLGGFNFFALGGWWQELGRSVIDDNVASNSDAILTQLATSVNHLTVYGIDENAGYGQPINIVPGTQPRLPYYIAAYPNSVDPADIPSYGSMSIQGWYSATGTPPVRPEIESTDHHCSIIVRDESTGGVGKLCELYQISAPAGKVLINAGSPTIVHGTGTYFQDTLAANDVIRIYLDLYGTSWVDCTVSSIQSQTQLTLTSAFTGTTEVDLWWKTPTAKLANTWSVNSVGEWDLTTGATRFDSDGAPSAAGTPLAPLLINYNEAAKAANGGPPINHPFRCQFQTNCLTFGAYVWPARSSIYPYDPTNLGVPMGARLRLKSSWYEANKTSFTGSTAILRPIVDTMRSHGLIVDDIGGAGLWVDAINDSRWTLTEHDALAAIPVSAFEILEFKSPLLLTVPESMTVNNEYSFQADYLITNDDNISCRVVLYVSTNNGVSFSPGPSDFFYSNQHTTYIPFTPTSAITYQFMLQRQGETWIPSPIVTRTVSQ